MDIQMQATCPQPVRFYIDVDNVKIIGFAVMRHWVSPHLISLVKSQCILPSMGSVSAT